MSEEKKPKKRGRPAKRRKPAAKKKRGRPSMFKEEVKARILEALRLGASYEHAANYGGVTYRTYRSWIEKGEKATRGEYFQFFHAIKEVEARAAVLLLAKIEKIAGENWNAARWKLANRHPEMYGEKSEVPTKPFVAPRVVQGEEFTDPWLVEDDEEG